MIRLAQLGDTERPLSASEQLLRIRARVMLAKLDAPDAPLPPALLDEAREAVAKVDATTPAGHPRQAAINAAANLYWEAGLATEANTLLTAELDKSKSPYYFMLDLANLAEKAGRKQEAVDWLARAYEGAKGPATRFQWGYNYLMGLVEMTPEDVPRHRACGPLGARRTGRLARRVLPAHAHATRAARCASCWNGARPVQPAKVLDTLRERTGGDLPQAAGERRGPRQLREIP